MAQAVGNARGDAVVIAVEDHDVHSVVEDVEHESGEMVDGNAFVDHGEILFSHYFLEVFDLGEDCCQAGLFLLETTAFDPDNAVHLVEFHADQSQRHICPLVR